MDNKRKKIITLIPTASDPAWIYKDLGMVIYSMSRYCNYEGVYAFLDEVHHNESFEEYVQMVSTGETSGIHDRKRCIYLTKKFIKKEIHKYDVALMFNYGSTNYKLAYLCKKYNPNIKIYAKLDMSEGGFAHFFEDNSIRKLKNYVERIKSRYIDLFTVETKYYFNNLSNNMMFKEGRLKYLPNGVSLLGVDVEKLDELNKENIILTVGRIGAHEKNNELLLKAIERIGEQRLKNWKIFFVGPMEESFKKYAESFLINHKELKETIVFTGNISDRNELYSLYARSKIICMTSRHESFCISTVEGMYFGCIPVITEYGHVVYDQTDNKKFGRIVAQNNVKELTESLLYYINNEDELDRQAVLSKQHARSNYDYKHIAAKLGQYLENV